MSQSFPSLRELLAGLIESPSVSAVSPALDMSNRALIERLAGWAESLGFRCELLPTAREGHWNLIATLGSGPGGLVLAGHSDTVPCDPELWQSDPFTLHERDGRFYGLGTCDMKSFLGIALDVVREFDAGRFSAPLILLATADEETGMAGARALLDANKPQAQFALIGEPTNLRPVRAHKGVFMEGVRVIGRSGHSSNPAYGASALEGMHRLIGELLAFRAELQEKYRNDSFAVPVPTLNLGHIHGGDNPNRICGQCELSFDLRPLPGMDPAELRRLLRHRLGAALDGSALRVEFLDLFEGVPPMETAADSPLVAACERLTGYSAESVAFGTEAPYFQQLGMDVVVLGPGDIAQAHQPDEFLAAERIEPMRQLLRQLIGRFCLPAG